MKQIVFVLFTLIGISTHAQMDTYTYKQRLEGVKTNTWHKVVLPQSVYGKLQSPMSDIRIYGVGSKDTIEVPYIKGDIYPKWHKLAIGKLPATVEATRKAQHEDIDAATQSQTVAFTLKNDKSSQCTILTITLPEALYIAKIHIQPKSSFSYFRRITAKTTDKPLEIDNRYKQVLLFENNLSSKSDNTFYFDDIITNKIVLTIENNDNQPLKFEGIDIFTINYKLIARFAEADRTYYLVYGKADDRSPQYDITHFENEIPKMLTTVHYIGKPEPIKVAKTLSHPTTEKEKDNNYLLWGVMGVIVALIFIFSVKMIRKP